MIKLSTYLESPSQVHILSQLHTIIVDMPFCSVRAHCPHPWTSKELRAAQSNLQHQYFCLNMDGLYSDTELSNIKSYIHTHQLFHIFNAVRLQDPGLMQWIHAHFPNITIQLNTETGFQNSSGLAALFKAATPPSLVSLNHELPYSVITPMTTQLKSLELFVQGPILIQYSRRQFLSDWYQNNTDVQQSVSAQDPELPQRSFSFLNTPFGHFMFAHFHRCLATAPDKLQKLSQLPWLVDARGMPFEYLKTSLHLYQNLPNLTSEAITAHITELQELSAAPQKPGFFLSNNTDYDWRDYTTHTQHPPIGRIVSARKGHPALLELFTTPTSETFICKCPDDKSITFNQSDICVLNTDDNREDCHIPISPQKLYTLPWKKGLQPKSLLFNIDT
jgi:collagenase-like PrtC family protease